MSKKKDKKKGKTLRIKASEVFSGSGSIFDFLPGNLKAKAALIFPNKGETPNIGDNVQFEIAILSIPMAVNIATGVSLGIKSVDFMTYLNSGQAVLQQQLEEPVTYKCTNPSCEADHTYNSIVYFKEIDLSLGVKFNHLIRKEKDTLDSIVKTMEKATEEESTSTKYTEESPVIQMNSNQEETK